MFKPVPQKQLTALEAKWEARLKAEGMPSEIRPLTASSVRDGLRVVPLASCRPHNDNGDEATQDGGTWAERENLRTHGNVVGIGELATTVYWRRFAQAVAELPKTYPARARQFLEAYAETGEVTAAAKRLQVSRVTGHRYLREFETYRQHHPSQEDD